MLSLGLVWFFCIVCVVHFWLLIATSASPETKYYLDLYNIFLLSTNNFSEMLYQNSIFTLYTAYSSKPLVL